MNPLEDEISKILKAIEKHGALDHLMVVGSWSTLFYQDYFADKDYRPVIRTTDIDFLIPKKPPHNLKLDVSGVLQGLGFSLDYTDDGWIIFQKPDLHIEFLWPRRGPQSDDVKKIPELGVTVRPLRFMWLLIHYPIVCSYKGIRFHIAHPAAFGIHKLIISTRRKDPLKRDNDRQQAEMVLTALRDPKDLQLLKEIVGKLSKKEKQAVKNAIKDRPLLKEVLKDMA